MLIILFTQKKYFTEKLPFIFPNKSFFYFLIRTSTFGPKFSGYEKR